MDDGRTCSLCKLWKPAEAFYKCRTNKSGLYSQCIECYRTKEAAPERVVKRKTTRDAYYITHSEEIIARATQWNKDHPEQFAATNQRSYQAHREERMECHAAYREENREDTRIRGRRSRARNPEHYQKKNAQWRKDNPTKITEYAQERRARILNAPVVERIDRKAIIARDRSICHICGKHIIPTEMSLDHLVPLARGGSHAAQNLACAHRRCNSQRSTDAKPAQLRLW